MAPGAVSLAGKPKLVMVPLDLAQIQPLHPFIRAEEKQAWLSPGCAAVSAHVAAPGAQEQAKRNRSFLVLCAIRSTVT